MKNFKKVLALVLVVATLFSFVAMASAKTIEDYSDGADVKYTEAVDVLSALGIINGYTDGTFKPTATIEREEMAKMIAMLRNAGDFDASLFASANKFADAKGTWAEGYIAYCAQVGIVAGRNASTFDPDGKVTGVEVLKMLLCVLGYDAQKQGYVGANWQVNVLRDANKSELLNGLNAVNVYEAATREQAAQMFLNALKANMVYGYISENVVKLTNSIYPTTNATGESFYWPTTPDTPNANIPLNYEKAYCNAILSFVPLYTIFGVTVDMDDVDTADCFGRPSTVWTIKNQYGAVILSKAYSAAPDYVFTADVELDVELGGLYSNKTQFNSITTYIDGAKQTALSNEAASGSAVTVAALAKISEYTGNGILTEVYVDGVDVTVVIVKTYIGQVLSTTKLPATATLTNGYTISNTIGLKADDYVLYHLCAGEARNDDNALEVSKNNVATGLYMHDVQIAYPTVETVIHASKAYSSYSDLFEDSYFQTGAAKFEYSATFCAGLYETAAEMGEKIVAWGMIAPEENEYDVYVNEYGYVMYVEKHVDEPDYLYGYLVEDTQDATAGTVVNGVNVRGYAMDVVAFDGMAGTKTATADQAITKADWMASGVTIDRDDDSTDYLGNLVRYEINKYGEIEVAEWASASRNERPYVVKGVAGVLYKDANNQAKVEVMTDRETQYMVRTWNWATQTYTYEVYVGYQNLPETLFGTKPVQTETGAFNIVSLSYLMNWDDKNTNTDIASHVFIDATYAGTSASFYILNPISHDTETALYPWLSGYTVYEALIDGQKAYVAATNWAGTGFGAAQFTVENALYKANVKVIDGITINGLQLYLCPTPATKYTVTELAGPVNGILTVDFIVSGMAIAGDYMQIAPEAPIHVVYHMYINEEFEKVWSYKTFAGETRDADFEAFFSDDDFSKISVYYTDKKVGNSYDGTFREITEMWIELTEK